MEKKPALDPKRVEEFVLKAHSDLQRVQELLELEPAFVNACWDWGGAIGRRRSAPRRTRGGRRSRPTCWRAGQGSICSPRRCSGGWRSSARSSPTIRSRVTGRGRTAFR
jgi:hypothetical protein